MARVLNFSLTMKDGYKVERDIADLREHFDLEAVLGLYKEGKLQRWLKQNKYAEEAAQLDDLDEDAPDFTRAFCRILGVEAADHDAVDVDEISERTWRRNRLRDYTADPYLLDMAENAAFSQSDLDELIDEGAEEIVLCDGRFTIPLKARGTKYYGAGKAVAVIESDEIVDFARKYITFQNVKFDEDYRRLLGETEPVRGGQADAEEQLALAKEYCEQGDDRCVAILERLAEDGNSDAMVMLSFDWYLLDKENDDDKAFFWGQKAADAGNLRGMEILGLYYFCGIGVKEDEEKYIFWNRKAAELGHPASMNIMGNHCLEIGSYTVARDWYQKAADTGDDEDKGEALNHIGILYSNGLLGKEDAVTAARYYEQAADLGEAWGAYNLAGCYLNGNGVPHNEENAFAYYQQAAEAELADGMNELAGCYANGIGTRQDDEKALFWYQKAAEKGNAFAMLKTGDYLRDNGYAAEARGWFEKLTEEGDDELKGWAFDRLGDMYLNGLLPHGKKLMAIRCYEKAASLGCVQGTLDLAECYHYGFSVPIDEQRAAAYYEMVVKNGDDEQRKIASEVLKEIGAFESGLFKGIKGLFS